MKKKSKLGRSIAKLVDESVSKDLSAYDICKWKKACKSFAPITYTNYTRKQWLKENRYRLEAAREIIDFIDRWMNHFRNRKKFQNYSVAAIKERMILVIRKAQQKIKNEKGILNSVKLNGFKTLVKWADNPIELKKGPYGGSETIPKGTVYDKSTRSVSKKSSG